MYRCVVRRGRCMMWSRYRFLGVVALIVIVLGCALRTASAQGGVPNSWDSVAPLPAGRMNPAAASADGRLYLFGGFGCPSNPCATFYAYTPSTNTWTTGATPVALGGILSATTGSDGCIYIYTG